MKPRLRYRNKLQLIMSMLSVFNDPKHYSSSDNNSKRVGEVNMSSVRYTGNWLRSVEIVDDLIKANILSCRMFRRGFNGFEHRFLRLTPKGFLLLNKINKLNEIASLDRL